MYLTILLDTIQKETDTDLKNQVQKRTTYICI